MDRDYFEFGYDYSILHSREDVVLSVEFRLTQAPENEIRKIMSENIEWRKSRHPDLQINPSAGSIFQKIEGIGIEGEIVSVKNGFARNFLITRGYAINATKKNVE